MSLFYIKYGCSVTHEQLIIEAETAERAEDYDLFEEVGLTEEEVSDMEYQDMLNDIDWVVEPYDEKNEDHIEALKEQDGLPFEV